MGDPDKRNNHYSKFHRYFEKLKGVFNRAFVPFVHSKRLAVLASFFVTAYYLILDVWGDEWGWVKDYKDLHSAIFCFSLTVTLFVLVLRHFVGTGEPLQEPDKARLVLMDFITTVGVIVNIKIRRFRTKSTGIKPSANKFNHITHPTDQIAVITNALTEFICKNYELRGNEIDVTLIQQNSSGEWHFYYKHQHSWIHSDPNDIMKSTSAAVSCLQSGEPEFFPDKISASEDGHYTLSKRDVNRGEGSVFVYPVSIEMPTGKVKTVISIVTYGKQLCRDYQADSAIITKKLLSEICKRYELELCLDAIKTRI